jgi:hypothetical protein
MNMPENDKKRADFSPNSGQDLAGNRTLVQKLGDWLARDKEEKEADIARLMRANIMLSFLTFMLVAGEQTAFSVWVMMGL